MANSDPEDPANSPQIVKATPFLTYLQSFTALWVLFNRFGQANVDWRHLLERKFPDTPPLFGEALLGIWIAEWKAGSFARAVTIEEIHFGVFTDELEHELLGHDILHEAAYFLSPAAPSGDTLNADDNISDQAFYDLDNVVISEPNGPPNSPQFWSHAPEEFADVDYAALEPGSYWTGTSSDTTDNGSVVSTIEEDRHSVFELESENLKVDSHSGIDFESKNLEEDSHSGLDPESENLNVNGAINSGREGDHEAEPDNSATDLQHHPVIGEGVTCLGKQHDTDTDTANTDTDIADHISKIYEHEDAPELPELVDAEEAETSESTPQEQEALVAEPSDNQGDGPAGDEQLLAEPPAATAEPEMDHVNGEGPKPTQATQLEKWRQARGKNVEPLGSTLKEDEKRDGNRSNDKEVEESFEDRERKHSLSMVLDDWETLTMHALSRDESGPQARLRFEKTLLNFDDPKDNGIPSQVGWPAAVGPKIGGPDATRQKEGADRKGPAQG